MRVAYLSPMPPEQTGIADYSAELLPELARHLDISVFTERPRAVAGAAPKASRVCRLARYPSLKKANLLRRYDVSVYQLGNNVDFHREIYELALEVPGVVVLHEFVLHHLVRDLALGAYSRARFIQEMEYAYGASGRQAVEARAVLPDPFRYPLFERVVDASRAVIVHSEAARQRILRSRPLARVSLVASHLSLPPDVRGADRGKTLESIGVDGDAFVLGSFGFVTPTKRLEPALQAFLRVRKDKPHARFVIAGGASDHYAAELASLRAMDPEGIVVTGRLSLDRLLGLMSVVDVAVNLRYPSTGETSGTCVRLLGLGRPVLVSDVGWFSEIPDDCCAKVVVGESPQESEVAHLELLMRELCDRPDLRQAMGDNARRWAESHHALASSAQGYLEALEAAAQSASGPLHPPASLSSRTPSYREAFLSELGADLGDLGVRENDEPLLGSIASTASELGLARGTGG